MLAFSEGQIVVEAGDKSLPQVVGSVAAIERRGCRGRGYWSIVIERQAVAVVDVMRPGIGRDEYQTVGVALLGFERETVVIVLAPAGYN